MALSLISGILTESERNWRYSYEKEVIDCFWCSFMYESVLKKPRSRRQIQTERQVQNKMKIQKRRQIQEKMRK